MSTPQPTPADGALGDAPPDTTAEEAPQQEPDYESDPDNPQGTEDDLPESLAAGDENS
jgi:hypothetical protein